MFKKRNEGFSLIEVVISILIIGVIAIYLATAIPTAFLLTQKTSDISVATNLAQKYIENVKAAISSNVINYDNSFEGIEPPIPITSDITHNGYFNVTTNVTDLEGKVNDGVYIVLLKKIDVKFEKANDNLEVITLSTCIKRPNSDANAN